MNIVRSSSDVHVVGESVIAHLKILAADAPEKHARLILHESVESPVQEMVICLHHAGRFRAHKHPIGKTESYHVIDGELNVSIFAEDGRVTSSFTLGRSVGNALYRVRGGTYHKPSAITEFAIYHEVYTGPYDKSKDVLYAPWDA